MLDDEKCYRAVISKDARFDGWFFGAIRTTGIYCRPSCPAITPKRKNMCFYPTAAAAHGAGYRACKRCRPDTTPGSPEWNVRADMVGRAMRLIADGIVDREGVRGLADRLGYSERHLNRQLLAEVGAGPLALARAQRAQTARILLETSDLAATQVAFAAGFSSVRQFNDTIKEVFAMTPSDLRKRVRDGRTAPMPGTISVRLPFRAPLDTRAIFGFLSKRAIPGVEEGSHSHYRRALGLPHGPAIVDLRAESDHIRCLLQLEDLRDLNSAVQRSRRLLDLDADPRAITDQLGTDRMIGRMVRARPGVRVPGSVDGEELAVRAVLGQQVSVAGARKLAERLAMRFGKPLTSTSGTLTHLFPASSTLADVSPKDFPMPHARARALNALTRAMVDGRVPIDPGSDRDGISETLLSLPGIGAWTIAYIRMRAMSDPDAFMPTDLGVIRAFRGRSVDIASYSDRWKPWRAYAQQYMWLAEPRKKGDR